MLARSAPVGLFEVKAPSVLEDATITPVEGEAVSGHNPSGSVPSPAAVVAKAPHGIVDEGGV